jgi:hypothetical protein
MPDVNINLKAKDDASLAMQSATDRLKALHAAIDQLRGQGNISALDVKNINAMSAEANRLERGLNGVTGAGRSAASALSGLVPVIDVLALANLAVDAGKAVIELGRMGEESAILEARSAALSGGMGVLIGNTRAMTAALGDALTKDDIMLDATKMLTSGIATTGQAMADLAEMAIRLGPAEENAQAKVEGFSRALQTGRATSLVPYGFNLAELTKRQEELQAANSSLTDKQALANAVLEQGAGRVKQLTDANVPLVTSQEAMKVATDNLKDSLGSLVAQPYTVVVRMLTEGVKDLNAQIGVDSRDANAQVSGLEWQIAKVTAALEKARAAVKAGGPLGPFSDLFNAQNAEYLESTLLDLTSKLAVAKAHSDDTGASMVVVGDAIFRAADASQALGAGLLTAAQHAANLALMQSYLPGQDPRGMPAPNYSDPALRAVIRETDAKLTANTKVANDYRSKMETAGKAAADKIGGYLTEGINFSKGLSDLTGPGNQPGGNGAFENIYRLQANLKDSSWDQTLQQFAGGDKEKARQIVQDFQNGIFSPDVIGAIDTDALAKQAGMAALAEKSQTAFAAALAGKAGTSTAIIDTLLGFKANEKGVTPASTAATAAMDALANVVGTTVKGKDFAGQMIGYGETIFAYVEDGMVSEAKKSGALNAAIDAMVAGAFAKYGGGGVAAAAGANGAKGL